MSSPEQQSNIYQTPHAAHQQPPSSGDDLGTRMLLPVGRSGWAIAAGYLGLFSPIIIVAPIAIIISIIAILDIRKSQSTDQKKYGLGRAIFGLIMGCICSLGLIFVIISFFLRNS